eukprot:scaffold4352_cov15-Prasinocladus_malaysianus.AAC.1
MSIYTWHGNKNGQSDKPSTCFEEGQDSKAGPALLRTVLLLGWLQRALPEALACWLGDEAPLGRVAAPELLIMQRQGRRLSVYKARLPAATMLPLNLRYNKKRKKVQFICRCRRQPSAMDS